MGTLHAQGSYWTNIKTLTVYPFHLEAERRGYIETHEYQISKRQNRKSPPFQLLTQNGLWDSLDGAPDTSLGFIYFYAEYWD